MKEEKRIYKIAKAKKNTRNLSLVSCIQNKDGRALTHNIDILNSWRKYFFKFVNTTHASEANLRKEIGRRESYNNFHHRVRTIKVDRTLRKMKSKKQLNQIAYLLRCENAQKNKDHMANQVI